MEELRQFRDATRWFGLGSQIVPVVQPCQSHTKVLGRMESQRGADRIHPQGSNRCWDFQSILGITIKDDEPWSRSKWKCFSQLLDVRTIHKLVGYFVRLSEGCVDDHD